MQADVEEIIKIKLGSRRAEDVLAWAPTPTGVFSVKSAYWLGREELSRPSIGSTSRAPNGRRAIWAVLWGCPAPPKVRSFAWRLATNSLATQDNKHKRKMEVTNICIICGVEREDTFHTFCRCTMARSLWQAMEEVWPLPDLRGLESDDAEWLLHLLDGKEDMARAMILMTFWRIWHCRNEVIHHKPAPPVESSRGFLCSYMQSLIMIKQFPHADPAKGKTAVIWETIPKKKNTKQGEPRPWRKPPEGSVKLNVDGSFCKEMGVGGAGVVLRDDRGAIIVSKSLSLQPCLSPLEAELEACREGVILALDWSSLPCMIEMDCAEAVNMIRSGELNRSPFTGLIQEIKRLMATRSNLVIGTISREQNSVSHMLANLGRTSARTQTWAGSGPDDVTALCRSECNSLA
jgi:ribonuclease HI